MLTSLTKFGRSQMKHALGDVDVLAHACTTLTASAEYSTTSLLYAPASSCLCDCATCAGSSQAAAQAAALGNHRPMRVGPYTVRSCILTLLHIMSQTACNIWHSTHRPAAASATSCVNHVQALRFVTVWHSSSHLLFAHVCNSQSCRDV